MIDPKPEHYQTPILGVMWTNFTTAAKAHHYARWAETSTRHKQFPCESEVLKEEDGTYTVKVSNW